MAGCEISSEYQKLDLDMIYKKDQSPLTKADTRVHQVIQEILSKTKISLLIEKGTSIEYEESKHWDVFWLVDPLAWTKEFLNRNGKFTLNIALIEREL